MSNAYDIAHMIKENPGIKFSEMMRKTGLKNGSLSYRLRQLEENGSLKAERTSGTTRYYPLGLDDDEILFIKYFRQKSSKIIIQLLTDYQNLTFQDIVKLSKISPSSVSITLSKLISEGIVKAFFEKRKKFYNVEKQDLVKKIIKMYNFDVLTDTISKHKASFTSIFLVLFGLSQKFILDQSVDFFLLGRLSLF